LSIVSILILIWVLIRNPDEIQQQTHLLFNGDGSVKPNVLGPPPQIKILKRPQHNGSAHAHQQGAFASSNGQAKPKPLVKTLQQVFPLLL
jgi:hypothetical protein